MKLVIQRVTHASVTVDGQVAGAIDAGFLILVGVGPDDTRAQADWLARKAANMRVFEDENDKMNLSLKDIGGSILSVSQFTLYADCQHGNRPSFTNAAAPGVAEPLYDYFCERLQAEGIPNVQKGIFGAHMKIDLENDGPVTIILER